MILLSHDTNGISIRKRQLGLWTLVTLTSSLWRPCKQTQKSHAETHCSNWMWSHWGLLKVATLGPLLHDPWSSLKQLFDCSTIRFKSTLFWMFFSSPAFVSCLLSVFAASIWLVSMVDRSWQRWSLSWRAPKVTPSDFDEGAWRRSQLPMFELRFPFKDNKLTRYRLECLWKYLKVLRKSHISMPMCSLWLRVLLSVFRRILNKWTWLLWPGKIIYLPLPGDDPKQRRPNITRAKALLEWQPKARHHISFDSGKVEM